MHAVKMAALVRLCSYHLIRPTCRHQIASLQQARSLSILPSLFCTGGDSGTNVGQVSVNSPRSTQKIFPGEGFAYGRFIGPKGANISRLRSECGGGYIIQLNTRDDYIIVSGTDSEGVKSVAKKVNREVHRIKNSTLRSFREKVLTDSDPDIHKTICGMVIGKGRKYMKQFETEMGFGYDTKKTGHILVFASDGEVIKNVVEKINQEVERIKNKMDFYFTNKLFTDKDADIHRQICSMLIGKGGYNINQIKLEFGPSTRVNAFTSHLLVTGKDAEEVNKVAEQVQQEIHRIRDIIDSPFKEKVLTDENNDIHNRICAIILGRGGENFKHLQSESGLNFRMAIGETDYVLISGKDSEVVKKAVEKMEREVETARIEIIRQSCQDSFHDWNRMREED